MLWEEYIKQIKDAIIMTFDSKELVVEHFDWLFYL